MKIQVRSLAIALAITVPIAVATTAGSSAALINGTSIKAAVSAVTTDVRYRVRRDRGTRGVQRTPNDYPYPSYWGYPTYNSYWGYPTYYYPDSSYGWGRLQRVVTPKLGSVRLPRAAASQHVFERF